MFCDLVGSTMLSRQLDPEDLQRLIRGYHETVALAIAPYEGHIAQFLGDGVLVYFGYPRAHEDDAVRAVHSGLSIFKALKTRRLGGDIELGTRIGIATGEVVVGVIGSGTSAAERVRPAARRRTSPRACKRRHDRERSCCPMRRESLSGSRSCSTR
jgi:class 3 adenylate cyclase